MTPSKMQEPNAQQHARWRAGHRRLPDPAEGALRLRPVRPRQHPVHRRAVRAPERHQDHLDASRERLRLHGGRLLPREGRAGCDLHVLRPRLGEPADLARHRLSRRGAVPRRHRQRADQPVRPRRIPGIASPLSGRLPLHGPQHLQTGLSADPWRAGADDGAAGLEDDGHRTSRSGRARRAVRRVRGGCRRRAAEGAGVERQHLVALRRRSRRRGEGRRHAAQRRAAGNPDRPGREVCARDRRAARARREAPDSGGAFDVRHRRYRYAASAVARPCVARRRAAGEQRDAPSRCAPCTGSEF